MIDGFKITAQQLKRILKIAVYLPNDYHRTDKSYPLLIALDGQFLFKFIDEDNRKIDLSSILQKKNRNFIVVGLFSPRSDVPAWRISELNPYYKGDDTSVDSSYSSNFANYITNDLIPLLKQKYRFNDEIYLLGIKEASILALSMVYEFSKYKGAIIYSPKINNCNHKFFEDIDMRFDENKKIYLYGGGFNINEEDENLFYDLAATITKRNPIYFILDFNQLLDNEYETIKLELDKGLDIIDTAK